jgi:hypothetical protein
MFRNKRLRRATLKIEGLLAWADSSDPPRYVSILSGFSFMEKNPSMPGRSAMMGELIRALRKDLLSWSKSLEVLLVDLEELQREIVAKGEAASAREWAEWKRTFLRALAVPL